MIDTLTTNLIYLLQAKFERMIASCIGNNDIWVEQWNSCLMDGSFGVTRPVIKLLANSGKKTKCGYKIRVYTVCTVRTAIYRGCTHVNNYPRELPSSLLCLEYEFVSQLSVFVDCCCVQQY